MVEVSYPSPRWNKQHIDYCCIDGGRRTLLLSSLEVCADQCFLFPFLLSFFPSLLFRVLSLPLATRSVVVTCVVVAAVQLLLMQAVHLDLIAYLSLDLNAALLRCVALWRALSCTAPVDSRVHPWNTQHQIYTTTFCIAHLSPPSFPGSAVHIRRRSWCNVIFDLTFIRSFVLVATRTNFNHRDDRLRRRQVWRVLSHAFVHGGLLHLVANMVSVVQLGPKIECKTGSLQFLILVLQVSECVA